MTSRGTVTQALLENENATKLIGASGSSVLPKKKQKVTHATEDPPSAGVEEAREDPKNPSPPLANPHVHVEDMVDQSGHRDPSPPAVVHEVGGSSQVKDRFVPLFTPQP